LLKIKLMEANFHKKATSLIQVDIPPPYPSTLPMKSFVCLLFWFFKFHLQFMLLEKNPKKSIIK